MRSDERVIYEAEGTRLVEEDGVYSFETLATESTLVLSNVSGPFGRRGADENLLAAWVAKHFVPRPERDKHYIALASAVGKLVGAGETPASMEELAALLSNLVPRPKFMPGDGEVPEETCEVWFVEKNDGQCRVVPVTVTSATLFAGGEWLYEVSFERWDEPVYQPAVDESELYKTEDEARAALEGDNEEN